MRGKSPESWFLGIDLGTGSCKCVLVDARVRVLGMGACSYAALPGQPVWGAQDPDVLVKAVIQSVKNAVANANAKPSGCAGLSLSSALHTLILLDAAGRPLTHVMTWAEGYASEQVLQAVKELGSNDLYFDTGCPVHGLYPIHKIRSLKVFQPDLFHQAKRFVSAKEYVLNNLTGEMVVDYAVAAGSGLLQVNMLEWSQMALDWCGITPRQLSPLAGPESEAGRLINNIAAEMGLPPEIPVILGSADAYNSSLGVGAVLPEQATCMVGTSGAMRVISPRPILDAKHRTFCYAADHHHWLTGGAINNGGIPLSWLLNLLNEAITLRAATEKLVFSDLIELAQQVGAGAGGLVCLPFLTSERSPNWNMNARGLFFGLTDRHNLGHITRAVLEGVAFRLRSVQDALEDIGVDIQQVRASGGFTRSDFWMKITASVLNQTLQIPEWGETSALGAATWAVLHGGAAGSMEEIARAIPMIGQVIPDPEQVALYSQWYQLYLKLYDRLADLFDEIAQMQASLIR